MPFISDSQLSIALVFAAHISGATAWGNLGHETVAYIAQDFVKSFTESYCKDILGDTSSSYLANIATWADSYKFTSEGRFSYDYHFIGAQDDPPSTCNVDYSRDCGDSGCSVSAIQNYIIGDIHQPHHDENWEVGGNRANVTYDGNRTNLHHIWDTNMLEDDAGGHSLSFASDWALNPTTRINSGEYQSEASSWLDGLNLTNPVDSAMAWASDANSYVCSTVLETGTVLCTE